MVPWLTGDEILIVACERTLGKQGWGEKGKSAVVKKPIPSLPVVFPENIYYCKLFFHLKLLLKEEMF